MLLSMIKGHILQFVDVSADIRVITVQMPKDKPFAFKPGQYVDVMTGGHDPRCFSIANAPRADNTVDFHVRNTGGAVSTHLCRHIKQGQEIYLSAPIGGLTMPERAPADISLQTPVVFIAGGTGITPFLAMIEAYPNRPFTLYWGANSQDDFYVRPKRAGLGVHYCTDIFPVDAYLQDPVENAHIYLSGPKQMVKGSLAKLLAYGVEPSNIYYDE